MRKHISCSLAFYRVNGKPRKTSINQRSRCLGQCVRSDFAMYADQASGIWSSNRDEWMKEADLAYLNQNLEYRVAYLCHAWGFDAKTPMAYLGLVETATGYCLEVQ